MKKALKFTLITVAGLLLLAVLSFLVYTSTYYRADEVALAVAENPDVVTVDGNLTILRPDTPSTTGIVFYPGGKVEHIAYLPLMNQLREQGVLCVVVEMPFRLAVFNSNAFDNIPEQFPEIEDWYLGGHSLGGAMASSYVSNHPDLVSGLILLGAYLYGEVEPRESLTLYGSEDQVLNKSKITYTENVFVIDGGNHAQFGNYGPQKGDGTARISAEEQQSIVVDHIMEFLQESDSANQVS